jgi:hypothetical protein
MKWMLLQTLRKWLTTLKLLQWCVLQQCWVTVILNLRLTWSSLTLRLEIWLHHVLLIKTEYLSWTLADFSMVNTWCHITYKVLLLWWIPSTLTWWHSLTVWWWFGFLNTWVLLTVKDHTSWRVYLLLLSVTRWSLHILWLSLMILLWSGCLLVLLVIVTKECSNCEVLWWWWCNLSILDCTRLEIMTILDWWWFFLLTWPP